MLKLPEQISCGYFDSSEFGDLPVSPKRTVTRFELEFYLEDGKTTTTDGRIFPIRKDYIQIAKPGQVRHSELPFRTAYLKFCVDGEIAKRLSAIPEYFQSSHPQRIYNQLDELILLNEGNNPILLYSKLLSLLNLVLSDGEIPSARKGKNYQMVSQAKRYIETSFAEQIKLRDIAEQVHLSEIYFHNIFTETVGITPHQYLIACRIEHAKMLLWNSDIPIYIVAEQSGFGCQQYLNKVFKKETGMTPVSYRKACQQNYAL